MAIREVSSIDGTRIVYRVGGPAGGRPLVLLHGWAANLNCWGEAATLLAQRFRVIAVDLRGHGYSDVPESGYDDPTLWAADVAAVLSTESALGEAVLVGWSYGGLVATDYIAVHGTSAVSGLVYAGAVNGIGPGVPGGENGPAMSNAIPGVFEQNPGPAIRAFMHFGDANVGKRVEHAQRLFGAALATEPRVRKALFTRTRDNDATLRALDVPALIVHGDADPVVAPAVARYAAEAIPAAKLSLWEGVKHAPFIEDPHRFVAEVGDFVDTL
jgi:pimeloyl-ACP methyl ester carboxylesterase